MTREDNSGAGKTNWSFAVAVSLVAHAVVLGAIVAVSRPAGKDKASAPKPAPAATTATAAVQTAEPAAAATTTASATEQKKTPANETKPAAAASGLAKLLGSLGASGETADTGAAKPAVPATTETKPAAATTTEKYTVRSGDSLTRIASRHGCTVQELAKMNGLSPTAMLNIGQVLVVPLQ